ncbi:flagellar biosynthetic protein FliR [Aeromonas diversa]|uniref:flagellar biosynthetic protein FliR n=1 Tax=Aeromonas diversa TaxID=502790 RepID=UPI0034636B86
MTVSTGLIMAWLASFIWPLCRVGGMLMVMVVFGSRLVPMQVRMLLSLAITLVVVPVLPPMPADPLFSGSGFLITVQQLLIGIAMGQLTLFLTESFVMAGQVLAMQTSLGFASLVDPMNGQSAPVVGQFYLMLATLVFLAVDGHLLLLRLVILSFETLPVSQAGIPAVVYRDLAAFLGIMFQAALVMSLSAIIALLLINFSFGVMTRAAPQLNIFSMGFAVSMIAGLFIIWLTIGSLTEHFDNIWSRVQELLCLAIGTQCAGGIGG